MDKYFSMQVTEKGNDEVVTKELTDPFQSYSILTSATLSCGEELYNENFTGPRISVLYVENTIVYTPIS
jgi:hypothetical protein